jgi:hypothetical protein
MEENVSNERRIVTVRDHLGVDLLLKLNSARCLAPFMREEQTLGSAAAELQMPASTLAYRVGRFRTAGLLDVVSHQARAGKPIPVYRATADEYHIPFDAMPPGRRDEFIHGSRRYVLTEFSAAMDRALLTEESSGVRVSAHPVRGMEISFIETDEMKATVGTEWWGKVRLTDDEAMELRGALEALGKRFGNDQPGPGRKLYITMFGLVPEGRTR